MAHIEMLKKAINAMIEFDPGYIETTLTNIQFKGTLIDISFKVDDPKIRGENNEIVMECEVMANDQTVYLSTYGSIADLFDGLNTLKMYNGKIVHEYKYNMYMAFEIFDKSTK